MSDKIFPKAYACYNKDIDIRSQSTSGGVFTLVAQYIIENLNGIVCGAAFDKDFKVHHICVESVNELAKLRGSKYPQSSIGDCYKEIKLFLEQGKTVLFTGTPCQTQGLLMFLNKHYDNLWCMDFVCHGVASSKIWSNYLESFKDKGEIQNIEFKNKIKGWKKWHIMISYSDHSWYQRGCMNKFMKSYLEYANIRPSCYGCQFKGLARNIDFTISDCWGIGEKDKEMNDNNGLSAFLIQNVRSESMFEEICKELEYKEYNAADLMRGNWTMFKSVSQNENRTNFFRLSKEDSATTALNKYFSPSVKDWIVYYIKRLLGKEK